MSVISDIPSGVIYLRERLIYPIPGQTATMWEQTYTVARSSFSPPALDTVSTRHAGHFLVEIVPGETTNGMMEYSLRYAQVPATFSEVTVISFTYPGKKVKQDTYQEWQSAWKRKPITKAVRATIKNTFHLTTNPGSIILDKITQPTYDGEAVDYFGQGMDPDDSWGNTSPLIEPITYTASVSIERWMGNIWRKQVVTVPKLSGLY
jgi:hypothetical protein